MALLDKRPTWFVKDGVRRAAYYTVQAKELLAIGFTPEDEEPKPANLNKPLPEVPVVAGGDAFEISEEESIEEPEVVEEVKPKRTRRKRVQTED
jgi:hypothetical protein